MDIGLFFRVLWSHKVLLFVGIVASVAAALFAGLTYQDGRVELREQPIYSSTATILVGNAGVSLYSAELPSRAFPEGATATTLKDLNDTAGEYAYVINGDEIVDQVTSSVGEFVDEDSMTAVQRTQGPGPVEDVTDPGLLELPVIDIVATSLSASRAEQIAAEAADIFTRYTVAQQDAALIPPTARVQLTTLNEGEAVPLEGNSPYLPFVVFGGGILLAFLALIFAVHSARISRHERAAARQLDARKTADTSDPSA